MGSFPSRQTVVGSSVCRSRTLSRSVMRRFPNISWCSVTLLGFGLALTACDDKSRTQDLGDADASGDAGTFVDSVVLDAAASTDSGAIVDAVLDGEYGDTVPRGGLPDRASGRVDRSLATL